MMSLKMWIFSLIYEIVNSWRFILFCLILLLRYFMQKHFIVGLFLIVYFLLMLTCLL